MLKIEMLFFASNLQFQSGIQAIGTILHFVAYFVIFLSPLLNDFEEKIREIIKWELIFVK